jgi:hypothetical protein
MRRNAAAGYQAAARVLSLMRMTLATRMIILLREIGGRELIPTPTVTPGITSMLRPFWEST